MTAAGAARLAAASAMFLFGLSTALLGSILPILAERLSFQLSAAGTLFLVLNLGVFLCVFGLGAWIDRRGLRLPMVLGPLLLAAALALVPLAPGFPALLLAALLLGLGGGALNVASNTLIAGLSTETNHKNSSLNWLGIFYGLGALLIPLGLGALLSRTGFAPILYAAAILCLAAAAFCLRLPFPPPLPHAASNSAPANLRRILALTAGLLFFQSGIEVILAGFSTTFLVRRLALTPSTAAWGLTTMWVAVIAGRLVLVPLALRVSGHFIVLSGTAISVAGTALLLGATSRTAAFLAMALLGVGLAGVFPTILGMTSALLPKSSGSVFGFLLTVSRTGAMALPWAAGRCGDLYGIQAVLVVVLASIAAVLVLEAMRHTANSSA